MLLVIESLQENLLKKLKKIRGVARLSRDELFTQKDWLWLLFEFFYIDFKVLTELY